MHNFMLRLTTLLSFRLNWSKYVSWRLFVKRAQCLATFLHIMTRFRRPFRRRGVVPRIYYIKGFLALVSGMILGLLFSYISRQCFLQMTKVNCKSVGTTILPTIRPTRAEGRLVNVSMELKTAKYFLLIGVMTADRFIPTRAKTIRDTWASSVDSLVKVIFFGGEQRNTSVDFDLVRLPGVDDTYPPQKKSFYMLKYVYERYMGEFHWFMRADDDVYIRSDRLSDVLRAFSSSEDVLFGQAGVGKSHEKGKLGLEDGDNFCIGGVGVVMSQSIVRKVAPYLLTCLNDTASLHEDVELGRCIRKHVGVMCPWAQEMQHVFYQNFEKPERVFMGGLNKKPFRNAITVHAVKEPSYMLQLHHHFTTSAFHNLQLRAAILNQRLRKTWNLLKDSRNNTRYFQKSYFYGLLPRNSTIHWEYLDKQFLYGLAEPPITWVSGPILEGVKKLINGVLRNVNVEARRQQGSPEVFKTLHFATLRTHPTVGLQLNIDVETLQKPLTSTRVLYPRHARHFSHFQQRFAPLWTATQNESGDAMVHFVVPLAGRFDTFVRFLDSFEKAFLVPGLQIGLLIVYFPDISSPERHKRAFQEFRARYPKVELTWSELLGEFSRARALEYGVHRYHNVTLLFFADVDLIFETEFYHRCRTGAILGQRVYFPLMFSQFNPTIVYHNQSSPPGNGSKFVPPWSARLFTSRAGVWRKYSYGPVCVYANDVIAVGGLNTTIRGWGLEDLDFYEKCLRHKLEVFRAPDRGLVHVYHPQTSCLDPRMNSEQAKMCEDSRRRGVGSEESLVEYMLSKGYL